MTTRLDDDALAALGFPVLPADLLQRRRNLEYDRAIIADRGASTEFGQFLLGWYEMPDGRLVYGMNDLEILAFSRESWRLQHIADAALAVRLEAMRPAVVVTPSTLQNRLFE